MAQMAKRSKNARRKSSHRAGEESAKRLLKAIDGRVALYIDAANLEKSVQALGLIPPRYLSKGTKWQANRNLWYVDYKRLYSFFKKNTQLSSISFYTARFGTKSHEGFLTFLKNSGYRLVTKPVKTIHGRGRTITCEHCGYKNRIPDERKADFDVEIAVDAVDWMRNYETFVLFSGDSDFVYLVNFLKKHRKRIVVLSRRGHVADELRTSRDVDCYCDIWKLRSQFLKKTS